MLTVASWNVNSLRARLDHVERWLAAQDIDILALQETKVRDAQFPQAAIRAMGYHVLFSGEKAYNGVALMSRTPATLLATDLPGFDDPQRRVLTAQLGPLLIKRFFLAVG